MQPHWLLGFVFAVACGGPPPPEPPAAEPAPRAAAGAEPAETDPAPPPDAASTDCPDSIDDAEAAAAYRTALEIEAAIDAGEADRDETRARRFELYDRAAHGFHRDAQERAGAMKFSIMFMGEAPHPGQRDEYIEALARLVLAARRGNERAARFMPGMDSLMFGRIPASLSPPLADLPEDWVRAAIDTANAWIDCRAAG